MLIKFTIQYLAVNWRTKEQETSLQIKDSGVAYLFLEITENKLCVLKILLPKNKADTWRMNMLSQIKTNMCRNVPFVFHLVHSVV